VPLAASFSILLKRRGIFETVPDYTRHRAASCPWKVFRFICIAFPLRAGQYGIFKNFNHAAANL
jgi:hypothetical protein